MDKTFLNQYHQELKYFRDASKEFAQEHPQVAKRLGLSAPEIEDPYVERLIEAVSFLTARINLKIDSEYPQFIQHILKVIAPEFTQPIPSAGIVELTTDMPDGIFVPKLNQISTYVQKQGNAMCQFSTCHDVQLVPFNILNLKYSRSTQQFDSFSTNIAKSVLNFELTIPTHFDYDEFNPKDLKFYIQNNDLRTASELLYFITHKLHRIEVEIKNTHWVRSYRAEVSESGFDHYLSLYNDRNIACLQHVLDYSILPEKYLFFKLDIMEKIFHDPNFIDILKQNKSSIAQTNGREITLSFGLTFTDISDVLEKFLDSKSLSLNSVVINNAFLKRTRVLVDPHQNEQHIVMDKLRPHDYEVLRIDKMEGYSNINYKVKQYQPLYKLNHDTGNFDNSEYGFFSEIHHAANFSARKNSYKGSEMYVMLNNQLKNVVELGLSQLAVSAWCSNRSLPSEISWSLDQDLVMTSDEFKVTKVKRQSSFTQPLSIPMQNSSLWRILNLISANFVPLSLEDHVALTQQIKNNLFVIYEINPNESFKAQINAILNIRAEKTSKVKRVGHQLTPVNGLKFEVIVDDMLMSHVHPYLWGRILAEYFKGFAPINHYVELCLKNKNNEEISHFPTS